MFTEGQIKEAVISAVAAAYDVDAETLTMETSYNALETKSLKVIAMIMFTNENLELEDDDELEFEDVMQCMTLQDTVDVIADKYGVAE